MAKKQEIQDKRYELYERAHTKEYYAVAKWLSEVSFAPAVLGADQADVWRKIEKLCELYEDAINAERARNAKLERKLRSLTVGKRPEPQVKPGQPVAAPAPKVPEPQPLKPVEKPAHVVNAISEPISSEKVEEVQKEVSETVAEVMKEIPKAPVEAPKAEKKVSPEEEILLDLLREFGPDKGGKANG